MDRYPCAPRPNYEEINRSHGLNFDDTFDETGKVVAKYWREDAYYGFPNAEADVLAKAGEKLWEMFIAVGDYILADKSRMRRMGIPEWAFNAIRRTWDEDAVAGYQRFDLRYGGDCPQSASDPSLKIPKLLEFNADTPTSILEAAVLQYYWQVGPSKGDNQWNRLYEFLTGPAELENGENYEGMWHRQVAHIEEQTGKPVKKIFFAYTAAEESGEDRMNTAFLADTAREAGYEVAMVFMENLRFHPDTAMITHQFKGQPEEHVDVIFKLYPWEWLVTHDDERNRFADDIIKDLNRESGGTVWIEPIYKMLWSNKGVLAYLWEMYKDTPEYSQYLLPAYFDDDPAAEELKRGKYVRKPLLGREGANVEIHDGSQLIERQPGIYGEEGYVVQEFAELPRFTDANDGEVYPVIGLWMIDSIPAGLGIREGGKITGNTSNFVPHVLFR